MGLIGPIRAYPGGLLGILRGVTMSTDHPRGLWGLQDLKEQGLRSLRPRFEGTLDVEGYGLPKSWLSSGCLLGLYTFWVSIVFVIVVSKVLLLGRARKSAKKPLPISLVYTQHGGCPRTAMPWGPI